MLHHKASPEAWHIEAIPVGHRVHHSQHPAHHRAHHTKLEKADLIQPCPFPPSGFKKTNFG
jgi:hypothetical protein